MFQEITYGQLRGLLIDLGFREIRRPEGTALKHEPSATVFLFRSYRDADVVKPAEVHHVRQLLDARGLVDANAFDGLLTKAPA